MKNWEKYKLTDLAEIKDSKRIPLNSRERNERKGVYPYYGASGIFDYVDDFLFDGEHVLISEDGENLKSRKTPIAFKVNGKFWVNNHAHIIKGRKDFINDWIVYFFSNLDLTPYITGAVQPKLSKENLLSIPILFPDNEHFGKKVVAILRSFDDKIELNRRMNHTLEHIAQTLFNHYFVGNIDPDNLPEGWKWGKISDIYKTTSGGTPSRSKQEYYLDGEIPWVKSKELNNGFILDSEEKINKIGLSNSSAKLLPKHAVLVAMYGATVGEIATLSIEATCNQAICAILPNDEFPFTFIFQFLKEKKEDLINRASGSAQQNISQIIIQNFELLIPPAPIIKKFHIAANCLFSMIESNLKENISLARIRDTLLPKLMSGEIDVDTIMKEEATENITTI